MSLLFGKIKKGTWLRFVTNHPYAVLAFAFIITVAFAWKLPDLGFQTSVYDLTIEDLPETRRYAVFKDEFGSEELILVVVSAKNVFDPLTFENVGRLSDKLSRIKGVKRVISLWDIKKEMDVTNKWSLAEFERIITPIDLLQKNLVSADKSRTVISLILEDVKTRSRIINAVEQIIDEEKQAFYLYQIGMPVVFDALAKYTKKDFFQLPPVTFLVIALVLFFLFRNARGIFLPICVVLLSLVWTFGLMAWLRIPLSMLTMIVPIFLIAVGTAYCMYIITEYMGLRRESASPASTVLKCFANISLPTSLAVFTTISGLCSLLVNKIYAIKEFALFSCFGMLSCLIIMFSFLPALMVLLPVSETERKGARKEKGRIEQFLNMIIKWNLDHQRLSFSVIACVVLFGVWGILQLKVETNPVDYFREDTQVSQNFHDIYHDMAGSFPINVVLDSQREGYFEDPENIVKVAILQTFLDALDGVDKSISFADYLKLVNYASNQNRESYYSIPDESFEIRILINKYKSMLGEDMLSRFVSNDFSKANILMRTHISNSCDLLNIKKIIREHLQKHYVRDFDFHITGVGILVSQSSDMITKSQIKSLSITFAIVFVIMLLLFISSKASLVAVVPNCFPIIINFGLMGWLGIELSLVTCLIASIVIGLAVDDTIHYLVTYSREIKKDLNKNRALHDTIMHVGKPIIFTTLAISLGFSILMFSHFKPTAIFGFMMVITMFAALVGDLILLPSLMLHVELVTVWDVLKLMKPLGGVSAGIAHELNQPLNTIKMGSEFLKMMIDQKEKIPEDQLSQVVDEIDRQVDRASETVNRLRNFDQTADAAGEKVRVNLNDPIRNVMAVLGHQLTLQNIKQELDLDETIPPVLAHQNRLEQVIYNLLNNARDAISRKQVKGHKTDNHVIRVKTFKEKARVGLSISDTGVGIPKNMIDRVFEPFFTCDEEGCSMGLGLSITYGIVKGYGGKIQIQSEEGVGTIFTMLFPFSSSKLDFREVT